MPIGPRGEKRPADVVGCAVMVAKIATGEIEEELEPERSHLITGEKSKMAAYAVFMGHRLAQMHRVLKPTGSIYLHCDHHAITFLRILLNAVFGGEQFNNPHFRNEIVWCYTGPGSLNLRHFNRKHDTVFWYTKGKKWKFNQDDIRIPHKALNTNRSGAMIAGAMTEDLRDEYLAKGKLPEDYWLEDRDGMTPVGRKPSENIGYSTQKPIALLERIIKASSDPLDLVMDPFCGCGTAADGVQDYPVMQVLSVQEMLTKGEQPSCRSRNRGRWWSIRRPAWP